MSTVVFPESVYLQWLGVVALLYPLCRRYAELKARSRGWR